MITDENAFDEDTSQTVHTYGLEVGESITFPIHQKKVSWVACADFQTAHYFPNGGHFHVI